MHKFFFKFLLLMASFFCICHSTHALWKNPRELLYQAINEGNFEKVRTLVEKYRDKPDVFKVNKPRDHRLFDIPTPGYRETPLSFAVGKGSASIVEYLLSQKELLRIDLNAPNDFGHTAFQKMIYRHAHPSMEMAQTFANHGQSFSLEDIKGAMAWHPMIPLYKFMMDHYPWERERPPHPPLNRHSWFFKAVFSLHMVNTNMLYDYVQNVLPQDHLDDVVTSYSGESVSIMEYLLRKKFYGAATILVQRGAQINYTLSLPHQPSDEGTILTRALYHQHIYFYRDATPFMLALIERGELNEIPDRGVQPIEWALHLKKEEIFLKLWEKGISLPQDSSVLEGESLVSFCLKFSLNQILEVLSDRAQDLTASEREALFQYALSKRSEKILLDLTPFRLQDPDSPLDGEHTFLSFAARHGMLKLADVLLEAGAQVDLPDPSGKTPLAWAREGKSRAMVSALMRPLAFKQSEQMQSEILEHRDASGSKCADGAGATQSPATSQAPLYLLMEDASKILAMREAGDRSTTCCACREDLKMDVHKFKTCIATGCEVSQDPQMALCQDCFKYQVLERIKARAFPVSLCHRCQNEMPVDPKKDLGTPEDKEILQRFHRGTLSAYYKREFPQTIACPEELCMRMHSKESASADTDHIGCDCGTRFCIHCGDDHSGMSCADHREKKGGEKDYQSILHDRSTETAMRPCPYCYKLVEKSGACDHMPKCPNGPECEIWDWKYGRTFHTKPVHVSKDDGSEPRMYLIPGDIHPRTGKKCTRYQAL